MQFEIRNRYTGAVQFTAEIDCAEDASASVKIGLAVILAARAGANLRGADLRGADLRGADLRGADLFRANLRGADLSRSILRGADLRGADLRGANLFGADLRGADLRGADLREADLREADLFRANLRGADLRGANLREADLREANLREADLSRSILRGANLREADLREANLREADLREADLFRADLRGADLRGADLRGADLRGAKDIPYFVSAQTVIVPEGQIVGWKKCRDNVIVKLTIPAEARRSNATGRKCRAEYADVAEVIGADVGISVHNGRTEYRVGQRVTCDKWCEDRWQECAGGIHFFITRDEAEDY